MGPKLFVLLVYTPKASHSSSFTHVFSHREMSVVETTRKPHSPFVPLAPEVVHQSAFFSLRGYAEGVLWSLLRMTLACC